MKYLLPLRLLLTGKRNHNLVLFIGIFFLLIWNYGLAADTADSPERLKRSESFLGIHFDFHAGEDCDSIGNNVDREMVKYILDKVHPDYVQCDSKGHPGLSSYPTDVGNQAPGFVRDPLKIWREVTAERGVALYVHYSGVWDAIAAQNHPEWARVTPDGDPDSRLTSVFGPYVDRLLIPQLKELSDVYDLDGVWVDGECWATERDYGPKVIEAFKQATGRGTIPKKPEDPGWYDFSQFCRQGFRKYLSHYVNTIHDHNPNFQIASNWAYSSMMPEPASIDVDFISGDFSAMNSINTARLEGRSMVHQGKPWDLMAWSFTWTDGHFSTKSAPQLQQEAAMVLSLGGGFQTYFPQRRDGSIRKWQMDLMAEVAEFARARREICHKAKPVPQIGLIYSGEAFYRINQKLFAAWHGELLPLKGILQSLLESQNVVDIVMEHHLESRIHDYPLLIYPEWEYISPDLKRNLLKYVEHGGNLLVIGPDAVKNFTDELGVKLIGAPQKKINGLAYQDWMSGIHSEFQEIELLADDIRTFGKIYNSDPRNRNDMVGPYHPASTVRRYGKGQISGIYLNLGERYYNASTTVSRDFLNGLVNRLFTDPMVRVRGSHNVDVTLNRKENKLALNLVNTGGPHGNDKIYVYDEIPPVGPLNIQIRSKESPRRLYTEPHQGKMSLFNTRMVLYHSHIPSSNSTIFW